MSQPGLRDALLSTDPRTAFNPFGGIGRQNSGRARQAVYVTLHNSGEYELPIYYATFNGDLFNLPAGPVSFAIGGEYDAPRFTRDRDALNNTFNTIGSTDGQSFRTNRDIWGIYEEVRVPVTSPTWNFWGFYSFEVDFAEREEWYSQNTSTVLPSGVFPARGRRTASIMRRSRRYRSAGSRWIPSISGHSRCAAAIAKRSMRRRWEKLPLRPRKTSRSWQIRIPSVIRLRTGPSLRLRNAS